MPFKKKTIKVKKTNNIFWNFIWLVAIIIVFFVGNFLVEWVNNIRFDNFLNNDNTKTWTNEDWAEINKDLNINTDKINILLIWRWGWDHDAPNLTDTMILISIDTKENIVSMLSIPRDLYVEYIDGEEWKINEIYRVFAKKYNSDKKWMDLLKDKIHEITWEKIDFHVNIDFEGFVKIVDTFGWVDINIPENFIDTRYPDWKWDYTTFILRKWTWTLDWDVALKYVRSRHSTSDFSRSMRQQRNKSFKKQNNK